MIDNVEISERAFAELAALPDQWLEAERNAANRRAELASLKYELDEAKADAAINGAAQVTASTAPERKKELERIVASDPAVRELESQIIAKDLQIAHLEAEAKAISKSHLSALATADLQAARLNAMYRARTDK